MKSEARSFEGTGKVFSFTVSQYFKSKTNIVTFIILLVMALASVPVYLIFAGNGTQEGIADLIKAEKIYVLNDTKYADLIPENLNKDYGFEGMIFAEADFNDTEYKEKIGDRDVFVHIDYDETFNSFYLTANVSEASEISDEEIDGVISFFRELLDKARVNESGMSEEDARTFLNYEVNSGYVSDYTSDSHDFGAVFAVQYVYSILVLVLCVMSASYIIRAVIEEKASKLVDLLMVSVKPLALILGKILGVMTCVFSMIITLIVGFAASYFVTGFFMDTSSVKEMLGSDQMKGILSGIGLDTIVIALISLMLGYLTFSIMSGISGAAASSMEDVESSNLSVMLFVLAGYIVSCITCAMDSQAVAAATSLIPIVSVFCAPVRYVVGDISVWILILSWIIQSAAVLLLAKFCSKVYSALLLYKGNKLKLSQIFSFAKKQKKTGEE